MAQQHLHVVVTGVRSLTHLVHIASYLRDALRRKEIEQVTVAYVGGGAFLGHATVTDKDVRRLLPMDDRLSLTFPAGAERWTCPADRDLTYVSVGVPGLKPWAMLRKANPRRRIRVVVTDEGIGTYGDWRTRRDAWTRQGVPEPWRSIRTAAVTGGAKALTTERWPLYREEVGQWQVVDEVAQEFQRHTARAERLPGSRRVVLVTQPWVDLQVITEDAYLAHVESIATAVDRAGGTLAVRPHPAEPVDRYRGFGVLTGRGPAELDPEVVTSAAVVGGASTAVLNLAAVFGLQAARIAVPGLEHLEAELSRDQRRLLDTFVAPQIGADQLHSALQLT